MPGYKRKRTKIQSLTLKTNSGTFQLVVPENGYPGHDGDLGLSYSSSTQPFACVDVRFFRSLLNNMRPRVSTHLHVFTLVPKGQASDCLYFFNKNPSMEQVDHAIRQGSFSPYRIDESGVSVLVKASLNASSTKRFQTN
jgi:hypothetical protein